MTLVRPPIRALNAVRNAVRKAYWRKVYHAPGLERVHHRTARPFQQMVLEALPPLVREAFHAGGRIEQEEYIHRFRGPVRIDPATGFAVLSGRRLLGPSLPYDYQAGSPQLLRTSTAIRLDRAISLRDVHEGNYFHFYNDVLAKLPLLRDHGLLNAPLIVGDMLARQPFFRELLPALRQKGLDIIEQGERAVIAQELIYCKAMPLDRGSLQGVLALLDAPTPPEGVGRKVFLTRTHGLKGRRSLANGGQVEPVLRANGFEVIEAGDLSVRDQMNLLSGTRQLVALHGAALTNMLFRQNAPLDVLEIFPEGHIPPHYGWMATVFGHRYSAMTGSSPGPDGAFTVDPRTLEQALNRPGRQA